MAYARRKSTRKTSARPARRVTSRVSYRASSKARRAPTRRRASAAPRTIRIVVETAQANPIARPTLGQVVAPRVRNPAHAS